MKGSVSHSRDIIRRAIYQLKYRYGYPISLYKVSKGDFNTQTGITPFTTSDLVVRRAIIMPSAQSSRFC
jgi:hypothetical protein